MVLLWELIALIILRLLCHRSFGSAEIPTTRINQRSATRTLWWTRLTLFVLFQGRFRARFYCASLVLKSLKAGDYRHWSPSELVRSAEVQLPPLEEASASELPVFSRVD